MTHALVLGAVGFAVSVVGTVMTWNEGNGIRAQMVPSRARCAGDTAILGGTLRVMQLRAGTEV
jgi:hypothetical protein